MEGWLGHPWPLGVAAASSEGGPIEGPRVAVRNPHWLGVAQPPFHFFIFLFLKKEVYLFIF
jgi:hypothetical protein